ncbi:MAG: hypothetical protein RLN76_11300 [Phycisphaeraceae bacterium]
MQKRSRQAASSWRHTHLLKGKLKTREGVTLTTGSTGRKKQRHAGSAVPYYISMTALKQGYKTCAIKSLNARHLDDLVRSIVLNQVREDP